MYSSLANNMTNSSLANNKTNNKSKQPSLPKHWPKSTVKDIEERPKRVINIGKEQDYLFSSNFVKTSKYEWYNFIPKFTLEEFNPKTKIANCYFLLVSALQCIPIISNTSGYPTTLIPLLIVLIVDGIFLVLEDLSRHKADKEANASIAIKLNKQTNKLIECQWHELQVGDIVKIQSREKIPADIVILCVAELAETPQGLCYVETKSLDGETNLKVRNGLPMTYSKLHEHFDFSSLKGEIEMEHPNKLIDSFTGVIDLDNLGKDPIMTNNILLRGCVLRNTDWVYGIIVNTGHDTKVMMSNKITKPKSSFLERKASVEILRILGVLAVICFWGATGGAFWNDYNHIHSIWYLNRTIQPVGNWFIQFFYYFLLHASFIPVSLYVSMALARFFQSFFINHDLDMYYEKTDTPALVRTMTLNEELGQISHIFSDKTGTLTCNVMDFRKMSINGVSYGLGITEIGKVSWKLMGKDIPQYMLENERKAQENSVPHVTFYDPLYEKDISSNTTQKQSIDQFFHILSLCHDVLPENVNGKIKLSASNPDDEALVCAADYFGHSFVNRKENLAIIFNKEANISSEVEVLYTIEFTSKRKRMSVIVKDGKHIRMFCKGADTVMYSRFKSGQDDLISKTDSDLRTFALEGLRCLLISHKDIPLEQFNEWNNKYTKARTNITEIEKKKNNEFNFIEALEDEIEKDLILIGATAIEDRLQDGVPECIADLAAAGINIWILTGDKEETAINIAIACNLILPSKYMDKIIINSNVAPTKELLRAVLLREIERYDNEKLEKGDNALPLAMVIDGPTLITAMNDTLYYKTKNNNTDTIDPKAAKRASKIAVPENADINSLYSRELLVELSKRCRAVVGCRVSPDQKREMVALVKVNVKGVRTLSIGDGANDVAMIQEAHVGVGIRGEEGVQAVNSSDIAIAQFRYLSILLLKHGRYNYIRMSSLVCYMFYKNILMSLGHFWFNFYDAFSGQKYYTEGAIQMFNLLYTSIPIILFAVYDRDINIKSVFKNPQLYKACINNDYFSDYVFWGWIATAFFESVWIAVLPLYHLSNSSPEFGTLDSFWQAGALAYTVVIFVCNFKLFFIQTQFHWIHALAIILSISLWFASAFFINDVIFFDFNWFHIWNHLMYNGSFWLSILVLVLAIFTKDLFIRIAQRTIYPLPYQILQEIEMLEDDVIEVKEFTDSMLIDHGMETSSIQLRVLSTENEFHVV